jgi:hypothetical protein
MGISKQSSGESTNKDSSGGEERYTIQLEHERIRQMVLAFVSNRPETARLNHKPAAPVAWKKPISDSGRFSHFVTLPRGMTGRASPHWLIQLGELNATMALGIEVISDVVFGVMRSPSFAPDFDLGQYGGIEQGVSRRHAMLRPSNHRLYLIDLASTNGTCVNGVALQPNTPVPLEHGDLISLGALIFSINIVATPADYDAAAHPRQ